MDGVDKSADDVGRKLWESFVTGNYFSSLSCVCENDSEKHRQNVAVSASAAVNIIDLDLWTIENLWILTHITLTATISIPNRNRDYTYNEACV